MLAALVAIFAAASNYVPLVGVVAAYLCPLPLAVLVIRHGLRLAVLAAVASVLVGAALAGPLVGATILLGFAPLGLVLGLGAQRGWPAGRIVALAAVVSFASMVLSFLGLMGGGRLRLADMSKQIADATRDAVTTWTGIYTKLGMPKAQVEAALAPLAEFSKYVPYLLPGMLIAGSASAAWLNYEVCRRVLARFGYRLEALPPIRAWRLPDLAVWVPVIGLLLGVAGGRLGVPWLESASVSVVLFSMGAFMMQGVLTEWVILGNLEMRPVERTIGVVITVVLSSALPIINLVLLMLGILDSSWKVRDRWGRRATASGARS